LRKETTMAKGLLLAAFNFSNAAEDAFHDWYDTGSVLIVEID
jgi:hypothetical protein